MVSLSESQVKTQGHRDTQGEDGQVRMKAGMGVNHLSAKEHQR